MSISISKSISLYRSSVYRANPLTRKAQRRGRRCASATPQCRCPLPSRWSHAIYMYTYIYIYIHVYLHIYIERDMHKLGAVLTKTGQTLYSHSYLYSLTHTHTYIITHTHTHIYIHTHTQRYTDIGCPHPNSPKARQALRMSDAAVPVPSPFAFDPRPLLPFSSCVLTEAQSEAATAS